MSMRAIDHVLMHVTYLGYSCGMNLEVKCKISHGLLETSTQTRQTLVVRKQECLILRIDIFV